jgi:hypothetical protein
MANRPPLSSADSFNGGNPFADRPHTVGFQEPSPFASSTTLARDYQQQGDDLPDEEKQPLAQYPGGFYPPGYATFELRLHSLVVLPPCSSLKQPRGPQRIW